jgi:hypothetical protein
MFEAKCPGGRLGLVVVMALAAPLMLGAPCVTSTGGSGDGGGDLGWQKWQLTFQDSGSAPHPQTIPVIVTPITYSSTWGEAGGSPGLWMYAPDGCYYQIRVGGNSFHDSPGDRFECVNLGGAGCGMQTVGTCTLTANGNFPDATAMSGTYTLTTTSPLGTFTATNDVDGYRE